MKNLIIFRIIAFIIFFGFTTFGCSDNSNPTKENDDSLNIEGYTLIWNDEFEGSKINSSNWIHEVNGYGGGNNELQYYTDREENSFVSGGNLHIIAKQETYTGVDGTRYYTSARMNTQFTQTFKYGKITARIKLPYGQGIWPAFWMLGENISQIGWPSCGEIDIMEMIGGGDGRDNVVHGTLHWEQNGHQYYGGSTKLVSGIFADDFHEFTINWDSEKIEWLLDGVVYHTASIQPQHMAAFHNEFFIILNLAIGGNWPGNPSAQTVFPQEMLVDYVRVYSKNN